MNARLLLPLLLLVVPALQAAATVPTNDARMKGAYRQPDQNGWTLVHLEGSPSEIGFQNGFLMASEIAELKNVEALELSHDNKKSWNFFREASKNVLWPHIEAEYREELQGIVAGVNAKGIKLDLWDVVALNASLEWSYFVQETARLKEKQKKPAITGDHCSAFVATGSYTKDGKVIIAHNNWTGYLDGERWTIVYDITPAKGNRFVMDGLPGIIHSADDFGINASGIMITETTISMFHGFDVNGIPEFIRARKAMQYANSIDDFARLMKEGNNGGYANNWLVADRKTNEVASLELGLKHVNLWRTMDGYFVGSNFPVDPQLIKDETDFNTSDTSVSANARHIRWEQLMQENKGNIDVAMAEKFLADHYDTFDKKEQPSERTLDGHIDLSPRGAGGWVPPYGPAGAVQNKVADAAMAEKLSFAAHAGHACGLDFKAKALLAAHSDFKYQAAYLRDMDSKPWTVVQAK
jgi:Phospholipase B